MSAELPFEEKPGKKATSYDMTELIQRKYGGDGSHLCFFDVPDNVGTNSKRRADAIVIGNWGSTGRLVHGFEIKISRSDWLRELKQTEKADPFVERCDRWWLVCPVGVARPEEIPMLWGWMTPYKGGLRIQKPAAILPQPPDTLHRLFALGLIRRAVERGNREIMGDPLVKRALADQVDRYEGMLKRAQESRSASRREDVEHLLAKIDRFEKSSGIKIDDWKLGDVGKLAKVISQTIGSGYGNVRQDLTNQRKAFAELCNHIDQALEALPGGAGAEDL